MVNLQLTMNTTRVINLWDGIADNDLTTNVVVVTDALYTRLASSAPLAQHWQASSYVLSNWQQSTPIVHTLRQQLPASQQTLLTDTVTHFNNGKQFLSVMLFAAFFMSCLFFLAAGSAIYFKLFAQQEEDRRREAARLLNREFLLLFFVPISLALVHSVVALLDLANVLSGRALHSQMQSLSLSSLIAAIMQSFVPIALLYLAGFMAYFWIARVSYLRRMRLATP